MLAIPNRFSRVLLVSLSPLLLVFNNPARADIFQWEYVDPADPSQGKRQSRMIAPDGAGVDAAPGADLSHRNLTMAYLIGSDLSVFDALFFSGSNLAGTNLSWADLTNANLTGATLTDANFTNADVREARFDIGHVCNHFWCYDIGTGISLPQIYSTASYQAHDLIGIGLALNDLTGANLAGQNLTRADLSGATLTGADFTGAEVRGASFRKFVGTGITPEQLKNTASYQAHDLSQINFAGNNLAGGNFTGQKLTNASLYGATLTDADFREANLSNADFRGAGSTGANFGGANLANANFQNADLDNANFRQANLTNTSFNSSNLSGADFGDTNLFNVAFGPWYSDGWKPGAALAGASFRNAKLNNVSFYGAWLTNADFSGADIRGAQFGIFRWYSVPGGPFGTTISLAQLYSTASYQARDLTGINLSGDLSGGNFAGQNLTNAGFVGYTGANLDGANFSAANLTNTGFRFVTLTGADFTGAEVRGANFDKSGFFNGAYNYPPGTGITLVQLYSTASYQAHDLTGINLSYNDLSVGDFAGQKLTNAIFDLATLTDANFSGADARGAHGLDLPGSATSTNLIRPDGNIVGLDLDAGGRLVVRDYDGDARNPYLPKPPIQITIDQHMTMGPGGTLRMVFEADDWDSTIYFAPGIPVALGGTLELTFAADVNLVGQIGRTFDLFDWTGVSPAGTFAIATPYAWDLTNLCTTGEVTLMSVPEPSALLSFGSALMALVTMSRVRLSFALHKG
jgi:uncharacterized protein YjbI with pentapeptide repeats